MSPLNRGSRNQNVPHKRKLVIVGDGTVGKTALLIRFCRDEFRTAYMPTVFDTYVASMELSKTEQVELSLWDTAGQEEYDALRPLSYPNAHVLIISFAIDDNSTLENVKERWALEMEQYCSNVPFILVGCKKDLRNTQQHHTQMVTLSEGRAVAREIGSYKNIYLECSAKSGEGVREVFETAARIALKKGAPQTNSCPCTIQ